MTGLEKLKRSINSPIFDRETHSCIPHGRSDPFTPKILVECKYIPIDFILEVIKEIENKTWSREWFK